MPQYVAAEVLAAMYVAGVEWGTAVVASYVVEAAIYAAAIGYSQNQASIARRRAREAFNAAQVDRLVNINSTESPRELVLGRVRKGGQIFFRASTGVDNTKFVICIALAGHELDAVESYYLQDVPVTLDGSGYVQEAPYFTTPKETVTEILPTGDTTIVLAHTPISGSVHATSGSARESSSVSIASVVGSTVTLVHSIGANTRITYQYIAEHSAVKLRHYLGGAGQTADATLMSLFPTLWTADHIASGIPYVIGEFDFSEDAFPSGLPTITAIVRGAKIYNPVGSVTEWTENPALMQRHVLLHPQFGKRTSLRAEEEARILQAAADCNTPVGWSVNGVSLPEPLYRAALVAPYGTAARDVLDDLATAMAGRWAHAQGQFFTKAGVFHASIRTIVETDLATVTRAKEGQESFSAISISTHKERASKFNVAQVRIWDAAQSFKEVPLNPLKPAALIARDGVQMVQEFRMSAVPYAYQALHIAGLTMRDARDPLTVSLTCKLTVYHIELFDTVAVTLARFGWVSKLFEVVKRNWFGQGTIQLVLKEISAANYDLDADFVPGGFAENTALTTPFAIDPPGTLTASSGTGELTQMADGTIATNVRVAWPTITNFAILQGGWIDVEYLLGGDGSWIRETVSGNSADALLRGVQDGVPIIIRARCRSTVSTSSWGLQIVHEVVGKTVAPTTPSGFSGAVSNAVIRWTWDQVPDLDYSNTEVRSSDANWGLASPAPIFKGAANAYSEQPTATGTFTRYIRHFDASWNQSTTASASCTVASSDLVDTSVIAPGAATATGAATPADGSRSINPAPGDEGIFSYASVGSVSWTNTTGASVDVEVNFAAEIWSQSGSATGGTRIRFTTSGPATVNVNRDTQGGHGVKRSVVDIRTVTVGNGQTLTMTIYSAASSNTAGSTGPSINWEDAAIRFAAIKR